jgi:hypothetical protein
MEHDLFGKPAPTFPDHASVRRARCEAGFRETASGARRHGAKLDPVQLDRADSKMVAAEYPDAAVEFILGNVERNFAGAEQPGRGRELAVPVRQPSRQAVA